MVKRLWMNWKLTSDTPSPALSTIQGVLIITFGCTSIAVKGLDIGLFMWYIKYVESLRILEYE